MGKKIKLSELKNLIRKVLSEEVEYFNFLGGSVYRTNIEVSKERPSVFTMEQDNGQAIVLPIDYIDELIEKLREIKDE